MKQLALFSSTQSETESPLRATDVEDGAPPVVYERSHRAKRILIKLEPFKPVRVLVPRRASMKDARAFVEEKTPWITAQFEKIRHAERDHDALKRTVAPIPLRKARALLIDRLKELSAEHNLPFTRVSIRRQRTLWGSCSYRNAISLNVNLVHLPKDLMDYVILHELMHTVVKNHGPKFWRSLEKICPGAKALDRQLRKYNGLLMRPDES